MDTSNCPPADAAPYGSCVVLYAEDHNFYYIAQQIAWHHDLDADDVVDWLAALEPNQFFASNSPFGLSVLGLAALADLGTGDDWDCLPLTVTVH